MTDELTRILAEAFDEDPAEIERQVEAAELQPPWEARRVEADDGN